MSVLHVVMYANTFNGELHAELKGSDGIQTVVTYTDADHMVWYSLSSSEHLDRLVVQAKNRLSPALGEGQISHLCWSDNTGLVASPSAGRKDARGDKLASRLEAFGADSGSTISDSSAGTTAVVARGPAEARSWRRKQQIAPRTAGLIETSGYIVNAVTSGAEADIGIDGLDSESGLRATDNPLRSSVLGRGQGDIKSFYGLIDEAGISSSAHEAKECRQVLLAVDMKEQLKSLIAGGMKAVPHIVRDSGHSGESRNNGGRIARESADSR